MFLSEKRKFRQNPTFLSNINSMGKSIPIRASLKTGTRAEFRTRAVTAARKKTAGILDVLQGFLTQQMLLRVEILP